MREVNSIEEVRRVLYAYHNDDIGVPYLRVPYLLAECAEYLLAENERMRETMRAIADGCEFPRHVAMYALQEVGDGD